MQLEIIKNKKKITPMVTLDVRNRYIRFNMAALRVFDLKALGKVSVAVEDGDTAPKVLYIISNPNGNKITLNKTAAFLWINSTVLEFLKFKIPLRCPIIKIEEGFKITL